MNYESILAEILKNSDEREKARITQEDALFKSSGWSKMIEFLCGLVEKTKACYHYYYNGSFLYSYLIYKFAKLRQIDLLHLYHMIRHGSEDVGDRILNGDLASKLFTEALCVSIDAVGYRSVSEEINIQNHIMRLAELSSILEELIRETGLRKREALIDSFAEVLVLSNDVITDADMDVVMDEEEKPDSEELEVLHKMLIVRIKVVNAL